MSVFYSLMGILLIIVFYLLPAFIAYMNKGENKTAIILINIFLGWTFLGWVGSFIWALVDKPPRQITPNIIRKTPIDATDQLRKLKNLLDEGAITDDEFETQKEKLLNL